MKRTLFIMKIFAVILVLSLLIASYNLIITPKYMDDGSDFPTSQTYLDFYNLPRNSTDVLFLGSSHAVCAYLPPELYKKFGITGYNLGCEQQNLIISYYWLEEALKTQSPQYVVCDCAMLYLFENEGLIPSREGTIRKALDFMRFSPTKIRAINEVSEYGDTLSLESFIFPAIRYHSKWTDLSSEDFKLWNLHSDSMNKGFYPLITSANLSDYSPFSVNGSTVMPDSLSEVMVTYLDKITALCRENDITLILTATPTMFENEQEAAYLRYYADTNGLVLFDFNDEITYSDADYCFESDNHDQDHANIYGAIKLTDYIGEYIASDFDTEKKSKKTGPWDKYSDEYNEYLSSLGADN